MIDSLVTTMESAEFASRSTLLREEHGIAGHPYILATFHRPSNVDEFFHLNRIARLLEDAAKRLPVIFPVHPRSQQAIERHGMSMAGQVKLISPLRYRDFIALLSCARLAITDSGGLQEETSVLGIPCLTVRPNTERPETISLGTNTLVKPEDVGAEVDRILDSKPPAPSLIPKWDGHAAARVAASLRAWLTNRSG